MAENLRKTPEFLVTQPTQDNDLPPLQCEVTEHQCEVKWRGEVLS